MYVYTTGKLVSNILMIMFVEYVIAIFILFFDSLVVFFKEPLL
jgi:hypothetical protein